MDIINFWKGVKTNLPATASKAGEFYYTTDTFEVFLSDSDLSLKKYTDTIQLNLEADRTSLLVPITNKFYYIKETNILWFYNGTQWKQIGGTGTFSGTSSDIPYDNTISGLTATNVKTAIDEIDNKIEVLSTGVDTPQNISQTGLQGSTIPLNNTDKTLINVGVKGVTIFDEITPPYNQSVVPSIYTTDGINHDKDSYLYLPQNTVLRKIGTVYDEVTKDGRLIKRVDKMILDGSLNWSIITNGTGWKRVRLLLGTHSFDYAEKPNDLVVQKYNGTILTTTNNLNVSGNNTFWYTTGEFDITISNSDSGWGDSYTPTTQEIQAYFMGWKMGYLDGGTNTCVSPYNGTGTKVWVQFAYVGQAGYWVNTVPTTQVSNFTPYQLFYQLATPIITDIPKPTLSCEPNASLICDSNIFPIIDYTIADNMKANLDMTMDITTDNFYSTYQKLNTIESNYNELIKSYGCSVYSDVSQSFASSGESALNFNKVKFDPYSMFNTATPSRITIKKAGAYIIVGSISFAYQANGCRIAKLRVNGSSYIQWESRSTSVQVETVINIARIYKFNVGDYVELLGYQQSGVSVSTITGEHMVNLSVVRVGD